MSWDHLKMPWTAAKIDILNATKMPKKPQGLKMLFSMKQILLGPNSGVKTEEFLESKKALTFKS